MASERSKSYVLYIDHIPENFNFSPIPFSPIGFQAQKTPVFCLRHPNPIQNFTNPLKRQKTFRDAESRTAAFRQLWPKFLILFGTPN